MTFVALIATEHDITWIYLARIPHRKNPLDKNSGYEKTKKISVEFSSSPAGGGLRG